MEHSILHTLQSVGLLLALGGPLLVLAIVRPVCRDLGPSVEREKFAAGLEESVKPWVFFGALAAALGTFADFFVQAAELQGKTVFSWVNLSLVEGLAGHTLIGQLSLSRAAALLLAGAVVRSVGKGRWWLVLLLAGASTVLANLVSHAAAQPTGRPSAIATQVIHLFGAAAWLGILIHLLATRGDLKRARMPSPLP